MKILVVSPKGDGLWYVWLLQHEGHDVDYLLLEPKYLALDGLIGPPLTKAPDPAAYDLVVYDASSAGDSADEARALAPTVGGSSLADKLEDDRMFGIEVMQQCGIKVPAWEVFDSPEAGIKWLEHNNKRTVFKPIGDVDDKSTTYMSRSATDMVEFIERLYSKAKVDKFVLQEVVEGGTEAAVGGWFNGEEWLVVDHNIEAKKLMPGDIGPAIGCAGIAVWLPPRRTPLFEQGLEKVTPFLRESGYVGPLDLNTIVTEGSAYGIEWTPRFAYDGTCNLTQLLPVKFSELLYACATGAKLPMPDARARFACTIGLSVPPYPNAEICRKKLKVPIVGLSPDDLATFFLGDVNLEDEQLVTGGVYNWVGSPICTGPSIDGAFEKCVARIKALIIPDVMWRNDISRIIGERYVKLERQGWLRPLG